MLHTPGRLRSSRHYHLLDTSLGTNPGYREEVFRSRKAATATARDRASWLAAAGGCRVEPVAGRDGYLITTGHRQDAGRVIEVEECHEPACLERGQDSVGTPGAWRDGF
jgi:hypothetical protein